MTLEQEQFFEEFYREHFEGLVVYAKAIVKNQHMAQDVVQDAFHIVLRQDKMKEFVCSPNPVGWMRVTVKNVARNAKRAQLRQSRWLISVEELDALAASEDDYEPEDEETVLKGYSEFLSENEMYLLRRLALDKATYKELADEYGISMWACYKRVSRLEETLAEELSKRRLRREKAPKKEKTKSRN